MKNDPQYRWAIRRYDVEPEGSLLFPEDNTEESARQWFQGFLEGHKRLVQKYPGYNRKAPELVRSKLDWEVVDNG